MIESYYWRRELADDLKWLRRRQSFMRWSEKQMVLFERRLILVAFQIRTLLEQKRVGGGVQSARLKCRQYRKLGEGPVTRVNRSALEDHFALRRPENTELDIQTLCNQLIHHYVLFAASDSGRFALIWVFSDFKRNECLYEFDVPQLLDFFGQYADDASAVQGMEMTWNAKRSDFDGTVK